MNFENRETRFQEIYRHITRLASGDFTTRLSISDKKDEIETTALLLNMLTEELDVFFYGPQSNLLQDKLTTINFLLDENNNIIFASPKTLTALSLSKNDVHQKLFTALLTPDSQGTFKKLSENRSSTTKEQQCKLTLKTTKTGSIETICRLSSLPNPNEAQLIMIRLNFTNHTKKSKSSAPKLYLQEDIQKIRFIHDYIIKHYNAQLPTLKELARLANTNEHKLKYGFKQLYCTTVFRFQAAERLKEAKILVLNTPMPIEEIRRQLGFINSSHFSRIFKEKFGASPKNYRKLNS